MVNFFASYLVERSMSYMWNTFVSDLRLAEIGVGQGSVFCPLHSIHCTHHEAVQAPGNQAWVYTLVLR